MRNFWIPFAATIVGLSAFGVASLLTSFRYEVLIAVWGLSYALVLVGAIVLAVLRKSRIAAGMFAGLAASILVFMTSCFIVMFAGLP